MKAVRCRELGPVERIALEELPTPAPGPGEVRIAVKAAGASFVDALTAAGKYQFPLKPPYTPGGECAGVVDAVGDGVTEFAIGDRVAYGTGPIGAYSEARNMPADKLVKLPDGIDDRTAAAIMLKGLTTQYLLRRTYRVKAGDTILVHAAAGGVGLLLCQWAKHLGATVIGTVGSTAKGELARAHGCDHTILYRVADVAKRVRELTGGAGVPVVYDGVGKDTFAASLDCLAPLGMMVSFGNASGPVASLDPLVLSQKGSLFFTRPTLMHYTAKREDMLSMAAELFDVVQSGAVKVEVNQTFRLFDAAHAHRDLESRKTTGSSVLTP